MPITGDTKGKMVARLGHMRLGATRLDYYLPSVKLTIAGVDRSGETRIDQMVITDLLNGTPNRLNCRVSGFVPSVGDEFKIALGQLDAAHMLFAGHVLEVNQVYEDLQANVAYDLTCVDYTWLLNRRLVTRRYTSASATSIAQDIVSSFTDGFSALDGVQAGLPTIDEITFTDEEVTQALDRLCARFGGYWLCDASKTIRLGTTLESITAYPVDDTWKAGARALAWSTDASQVANRVHSIGAGSVALVPLSSGDTIVPIEDSSVFPSSGTAVSGPQAFTFSSKAASGTGASAAGVPVAVAAPTATANDANGSVSGNVDLATGTEVRYLITHVIGDGETAAGTASDEVLANVRPTVAPLLAGTTGGSLDAGAIYQYYIRYRNAGGSYSDPSPVATIDLGASENLVQITQIPVSDNPLVTQRAIFRTEGGGSVPKFLANISDNSTTFYNDSIADGSLGALMSDLATNMVGATTVTVSGIPIGPAGTTARRVYRSMLERDPDNPGDYIYGPYKYSGTVSDNVTTTYVDTVDSQGLGEAAPAFSTVPTQAGASTLRVTDLSVFSATGGYVTAEGQVIRYTGRSASSGEGTLTGVPTSGVGSIVSDISAGAAVLVTPALLGVPASGDGSISYSIQQGDPVNFRVTVNDTDSQTALAGLFGGDGIHEVTISDNRLSVAEATARGQAFLDLSKDLITTARYATRDQSSRSGRTVAFDLGAPTSLSGTLRIQSVTITEIGESPEVFPLRQIEASSRRFSLEDLLRQIRSGTRAA